MTPTTFAISSVCSAFEDRTIGSKVIDPYRFLKALQKAVEDRDWSQEGQQYVDLPPEVNEFVTSGVGKRSTDPGHFVVREHRGRVGAYLKRHKAASVESVGAVVYTRDAYFADPDVDAEERVRVERALPFVTHVIVAVLAQAGPKPSLTPYRFVHNLAGGNNDYNLCKKFWKIVDHVESDYGGFAKSPGFTAGLRMAEDLEKEAIEIKKYADEWCVVAD